MLYLNAAVKKHAHHFDQKPWQRVHMVYASDLWYGQPDKSKMPSMERMEMIAERNVDQIVCLDIEHLPTDPRKHGDHACEQAKDFIIKIIDRFREFRAGMRIGMYRLLPISDYWACVGKGRSTDMRARKEWKRACRFMAYGRDQFGRFERRSLADVVDVTFPRLYTFYDDVDQWRVYAEETIDMARVYQGECYPFIWPQYHNNAKEHLAGKILSADYWLSQLCSVGNNADGACVWMPSSYEWDENAGWWNSTQNVVKERQLLVAGGV